MTSAGFSAAADQNSQKKCMQRCARPTAVKWLIFSRQAIALIGPSGNIEFHSDTRGVIKLLEEIPVEAAEGGSDAPL
jgi:hypothetical protein